MAVKSEQVEKNLVKLVFEVSAEEFEKATNRVFAKNQKKYNVPGFRKGKAPKQIIEKYYSPAVFYDEALNLVLPEAYDAAVKEAGVEVVARPEIDIENEIKKGEPVVFVALVTTKPEVTLGDYKGIEVEKFEHTVSEEDINKDLEATQKRNARLIPVEDRAVAQGDITTIDFEGFVDGVAFDGGKGENYELEIGSNMFIPGFEDALVGAELEKETSIDVTFPEDYHVAELAGKPAVFKVTVHEIKIRELPELDDDFASEVSEFDTLTEYKKSIQERLEKEAAEKAKSETENAVVEKVVANAQFDIPEAMLEAQIDRMVDNFAQRLQYQGLSMEAYLQYTGGTMEAFRETFKEQAQRNVSADLVIEAVMKKEGIETGEEELEMNLIDMAKKYNMETDKLKELLSEDEIAGIKRDMAMSKTIEMMVNHAVVK